MNKEGENMKKIYVDPIRLDSSAMKIESEIEAYHRCYMMMFDEVEKMKNAWQGKDNVAFTNQIRQLEAVMKQIQVLCQQYAEFLRNSARAYRETQNELMNQAGRI